MVHLIAPLCAIYLYLISTSALPLALPQAASQASPVITIYPQKAAGDAPYDISESILQAAIKLPANFEPGKKMPIILAPGTASTGSETYAGTFLKLMNNSDTYDPIPLDIPGNLLGDIQGNAEYHAYAINYIGMMTNRQIAMVTWSQGSLDMQWALKYWPSTRPVVSDFVAFSADLNGTKLEGFGAYFATNVGQGIIPVAPSLFQQESTSVFIKTIRANGGNSAYVPTTSIYSSADDVVFPQEGTNASAYFKSDNGVPAMNYQIQTICANQIAGGNYTHRTLLYNSFAVAIAMDAFSHDGPGDATRLDLGKVCSLPIAEGLNDNDKNITDNTLATEATDNVLLGEATLDVKLLEPPIRAYAAKDRPVGYVAPSLYNSVGTGVGTIVGGVGNGLGIVVGGVAGQGVGSAIGDVGQGVGSVVGGASQGIVEGADMIVGGVRGGVGAVASEVGSIVRRISKV